MEWNIEGVGITEDQRNAEGFLERHPSTLALSILINRMIEDHEREYNEKYAGDLKIKVVCSAHGGIQYPEAFPHEPKVQLLCLFNDTVYRHLEQGILSSST